MRGRLLLCVMAGCVAVLPTRGGFGGEPGAARAQAGKGGEADRSPPGLKKGVRVAFMTANHPFNTPDFEGVPVVEEVQGRWVRITRAITKDAQRVFKQREMTVWVNFDLVSWY